MSNIILFVFVVFIIGIVHVSESNPQIDKVINAGFYVILLLSCFYTFYWKRSEFSKNKRMYGLVFFSVASFWVLDLINEVFHLKLTWLSWIMSLVISTAFYYFGAERLKSISRNLCIGMWLFFAGFICSGINSFLFTLLGGICVLTALPFLLIGAFKGAFFALSEIKKALGNYGIK